MKKATTPLSEKANKKVDKMLDNSWAYTPPEGDALLPDSYEEGDEDSDDEEE